MFALCFVSHVYLQSGYAENCKIKEITYAVNYNHLLYFQKLATYEHYGKAAEELHITQPSLSNAIHNLEEDLGVPLFEKSGRGVRLTKQGMRFLEYVNHALQEIRMGTQMLHYEQMQTDTLLRLGLIMAVAYGHFPEWIRGFQEKTGRKLFYSCTNDTSDALSLELKAGRLDLIICSRLDDPRVELTPLFRQQLVLLTPKKHRFASRKTVNIRELDGESFVAHSRSTALHDTLADIYTRNHIDVKIVGEADEDRTIIGMVRAGLGCGVTTHSPELFGTDFSVIPIEGSGFNGQVYVGKRRGAQLSGQAEAFYKYLTAEAAVNRILTFPGS